MKPTECLRRYVDVFRTTLKNGNSMCLGGIMAAENKEQSVEVRAAVVEFSKMNVWWLTQILSLRKEPHSSEEPMERHALAIYAGIGGAQLIARGFEDVSMYDNVIEAYESNGLVT